MLSGRYAEALAKREEAESMLESLQRARPAENYTYELASSRYAKAACLAAVGREEEALRVIEQSAQGYAELQKTSSFDVRHLLADVRARQGHIQTKRGYGASAVVDLDSALTAHLHLAPVQAKGLERLLDIARVASQNALVLSLYGDPDLAVASADYAIGIYISRASEINAVPQLGHMHAQYFGSAAPLAVRIHAAHERFDIACEAAGLHEQLARANAQSQTSAAVGELARALSWHAHIQSVRGHHGEAAERFAEARSIDSAIVQRVDEEWRAMSERRHPFLNTVAKALAIADQKLGSSRVSADLVRALVSPSRLGSTLVFTPSARCPSDERPSRAGELAELATELWPLAPDAARRLALEAHYLFAATWAQGLGSSEHLWSSSSGWTRALLSCADAYRQFGDTDMVADLSDWSQLVLAQRAERGASP